MRSIFLTLTLTCLATPAIATTCEESFQKKGDFFNGTAFSARVQVEGLSVEKAFAQLRPILAREGIKTLSTDLETGVMKAENPATPFQRALPIDVFASMNDNLLDVEMVFTLPGGVGASRKTVRDHLCKSLNQLAPKSAIAAPTPLNGDTTITAIESPDLAQQVAAAADNPARIRLNFIGKRFRVSGVVLDIADQSGSYVVSFDSVSRSGGKVAPSGVKPLKVLCLMAKDQDAAVAALQTNQRATLVGRFQSFDKATSAIKLQECVPG